MHPASCAGRRSRRRALALGCLFLLAMSAVQAFYASQLNRLYYSHLGPIFDSASYLNRAAEVMTISRQEGLLEGLGAAVAPANVMLPYLAAAFAGQFAEPSRALGVWWGEIWLAALGVAVYSYLLAFRQIHPVAALAFTAPFVSFATVYWHSGGLSDFRMDLPLYALLGLTAISYLAGWETASPLPWAAAAIFAALTVLCRATALAYLAAMLAPLLALQVWIANREGHTRILRYMFFFGLPALAVIAVFYASRYGFLHHYYFVWGSDPTANLPLSQSAGHFALGLHHLGNPLKTALAVTLVVQLAVWTQHEGGRSVLSRLDARTLWLGLAPGLLLAATGAGLNAFVSMPMVFGAALFCLAPLRGRHAFTRLTPAACVACVFLVAASLTSAALGIERHRYRPGRGGEMAAFNEAVALLRSEARALGKSEVSVVSTTVHTFATEFLRNALVYEHGGRTTGGPVTLPDGLHISTPHRWRFAPLVAHDWNSLPGTNDEQKYQRLLEAARRDLDFLFLPDEPTIDYLEGEIRHNYQNLKVRELRRRLLATGDWEPAGRPIVFAPGQETLTLYRNRRRTGKASS